LTPGRGRLTRPTRRNGPDRNRALGPGWRRAAERPRRGSRASVARHLSPCGEEASTNEARTQGGPDGVRLVPGAAGGGAGAEVPRAGAEGRFGGGGARPGPPPMNVPTPAAEPGKADGGAPVKGREKGETGREGRSASEGTAQVEERATSRRGTRQGAECFHGGRPGPAAGVKHRLREAPALGSKTARRRRRKSRRRTALRCRRAVLRRSWPRCRAPPRSKDKRKRRIRRRL